jgi:hypothetical protein
MTAFFTSPLTWIIFGATAQLTLAAWVRAPRSPMWVFPPIVIGASLLGAIPTALDGDPYAYQIGMGFGLMFAAAWIAHTAPAAMNEGIVLGVTTAYWTSFFVAGEPARWAALTSLPAILIAAIPSATIVAIAATGYRPERWLRFMLYLWALFALVDVGVMRFPLSDFTALESAGLGWVVILAAAHLGAHLAMLVHNVMSLLILVPFTGEDQTFKQRLKEIGRYADRLIAAYSPEPIARRYAILIVAGQAAFMCLLSRWRPEGAALAVHACLSLCLAASIFFTRPPVAAGVKYLPTGGDIAQEKRRRKG